MPLLSPAEAAAAAAAVPLPPRMKLLRYMLQVGSLRMPWTCHEAASLSPHMSILLVTQHAWPIPYAPDA